MEIKININGKILSAEAGELLSKLLIKNGVYLASPCGGRGVCGKCKVFVDGREELACKYVLSKDITVEIPIEGEILSDNGETEAVDYKGTDIVLDIGTTTLAMALVDGNEKKLVNIITANNPQRAFGADVMSRIEYCRKNGESDMTRLIREQCNKLIAKLYADGAETLHVVGNTVMLHIFAGVDPTPMGAAPYKPTFLSERTESAESFGIVGVRNVRLLPSVSAFVGSDLVAGINYVGLPKKGCRLLIDLGTNAEIILFSRDKVIATSAAAGPCFEGASISCGMSATNGAIYAYDGKAVKTIGGTEPKGICGTGLVDVIAELLKKGVIDGSGYMKDGDFELSAGVKLTQGDVRQYQLAKSAVISAVLTIMRKNDIEFSDIESLYISGGFSAKISIDNAVYTGLIPKELREVSVSVGNSSLLGAIKAVLEGSALSEITDRASYADMSSDGMFSELFIENMGFEI